MCAVNFMYITPNKKIQNHREPPYKLCLEKACLLCSPTSSALEDDSDDEPEDNTAFPNLANFQVPDEPSSGEEGGGGEEGEEGSEEGGEKEIEDSEEDVPLAQRKRKVARV